MVDLSWLILFPWLVVPVVYMPLWLFAQVELASMVVLQDAVLLKVCLCDGDPGWGVVTEGNVLIWCRSWSHCQ